MREHVLSIVERYLGERHRRSGESNITLKCPFHKGGEETKASFSINLDLGLFHCFTCHVSGTLPHLLRLLSVPEHIIDAETRVIQGELEDNKAQLLFKRKSEWRRKDPFQAQTILSPVVLKPYEWCPMPLVESGFDPLLLQAMQVGFDIHNKRITYPVHDIYGNLAGVVGGKTEDWQQPKYKVYTGRQTDPRTHVVTESDYGSWFHESYPGYEFQNHEYLWNYDRVYPRLFFSKEVETLIIVEGFKACLWLLQNGYWNTVALMGSRISRRQMQLLFRLRANFVLFLDHDPAGIEGTLHDGLQMFLKSPNVRAVRYLRGVGPCQPDDLPSEELHKSIANAIPFPQFAMEAKQNGT